MQTGTISRYAALADQRERDPIVIPGEHGRADVANGRMSKWQRFNRADQLLWVTDSDGTPRALTRRQHSVLLAVRRLDGTGVRLSMRDLASHLGVSPSSVSRAAVKLASFGFIAYQSNRGRFGGTVWVLRSANDTLGWFQESAKAKVRAWAKAAALRWARLLSNVAPYPKEGVRVGVSTVTPIERNIKRGWSPDELREAGII